jgi:hypothetical protein
VVVPKVIVLQVWGQLFTFAGVGPQDVLTIQVKVVLT